LLSSGSLPADPGGRERGEVDPLEVVPLSRPAA